MLATQGTHKPLHCTSVAYTHQLPCFAPRHAFSRNSLTPLHYASADDHAGAAALLISAKADIHARGKLGQYIHNSFPRGIPLGFNCEEEE
jgi:hypothetical protein